MAMLDTLRHLVHDNPINGETHFSDGQLTAFLDVALIDVRIWSGTSYADISALEAAMSASPSTLDQQVYMCTLLYAQILCAEADGTTFQQYVKMVTQDTAIDPGDAGSRIDKVIRQLKQSFEMRIKAWFGIQDGAMIWTAAGDTEF